MRTLEDVVDSIEEVKSSMAPPLYNLLINATNRLKQIKMYKKTKFNEDNNLGTGNTGKFNIGNNNSGDSNVGNNNQGSNNIGSYNLASKQVGYFNCINYWGPSVKAVKNGADKEGNDKFSKVPVGSVRFFDKFTQMYLAEFNAKYPLPDIKLNFDNTITDKRERLLSAFKEAWNVMNDSDREMFLRIPFFDKSIIV